MNRDYIDWLTSLPNNRGVRDRQINVWMVGYAPLTDEIDLEHCEEMQQRGWCVTALTACWEGYGGGCVTDSPSWGRRSAEIGK